MNDLDWLSDTPAHRTTDVRRKLMLDRRTYDVTAFEDGDGTVGVRLVGWDSGYMFTEFVAELPTGDATDVGQLIASALAGFRDSPVGRPPDPEPQHSWWTPPDRLRPPNWGKPWEPEDLDLLVSRFREGVSIKALTEELGRSDGAIRSRLQLLGETRPEALEHADEAPQHGDDAPRLVDEALRLADEVPRSAEGTLRHAGEGPRAAEDRLRHAEVGLRRGGEGLEDSGEARQRGDDGWRFADALEELEAAVAAAQSVDDALERDHQTPAPISRGREG